MEFSIGSPNCWYCTRLAGPTLTHARLAPVLFPLFPFLLVVGYAIVRASTRRPRCGHERICHAISNEYQAHGVGRHRRCRGLHDRRLQLGGWVTGGTARKDAATAAHDAVVVALAPICADRFRAQGDAPAKIAELAKASSWERGSVVEKSGYALMPGSKTTDSDVARACAEMLATPPTPKT